MHPMYSLNVMLMQALSVRPFCSWIPFSSITFPVTIFSVTWLAGITFSISCKATEIRWGCGPIDL